MCFYVFMFFVLLLYLIILKLQFVIFTVVFYFIFIVKHFVIFICERCYISRNTYFVDPERCNLTDKCFPTAISQKVLLHINMQLYCFHIPTDGQYCYDHNNICTLSYFIQQLLRISFPSRPTKLCITMNSVG